jgi:serine O-acetyltransferase
MDGHPTFIWLLWIWATVWAVVSLVIAAWFCIGIPAAVIYAKRLDHHGSWWALYVLGLHAALAPAYRRLQLSRIIGHSVCRLVRILYQLLTIPTGVEIPLGTKIGKGILLGHTAGVVLHAFAVVGDYCAIAPGVVLGGNGRGGAPAIGRNVYIGANAVIAGPVVVGDSATIGAGTVVTKDIPIAALVVGNPGVIVKENYKRSYHNYAKESGCE